MILGKQLSLNDDPLMEDPHLYRNTFGSLQYLLHTRSDIAFTVNKLSQFTQSPTTCH